jgi:hypothetical protein
MEMTNIDKDAFSSGQIGSKLWLCQQLEQLGVVSKETAIYGGWHGVLAFLLLSRDNYKVEKIRSYDIDPSCEHTADIINEYWVWQEWKFKAYTADCNTLNSDADVVINTSTEHFDNLNWWHNIKQGTTVVLQSNNMPHDDHFNCSVSLEQFCDLYPVTQELYRGSLSFVYPDWKFDRYMLIGVK